MELSAGAQSGYVSDVSITSESDSSVLTATRRAAPRNLMQPTASPASGGTTSVTATPAPPRAATSLSALHLRVRELARDLAEANSALKRSETVNAALRARLDLASTSDADVLDAAVSSAHLDGLSAELDALKADYATEVAARNTAEAMLEAAAEELEAVRSRERALADAARQTETEADEALERALTAEDALHQLQVARTGDVVAASHVGDTALVGLTASLLSRISTLAPFAPMPESVAAGNAPATAQADAIVHWFAHETALLRSAEDEIMALRADLAHARALHSSAAVAARVSRAAAAAVRSTRDSAIAQADAVDTSVQESSFAAMTLRFGLTKPENAVLVGIWLSALLVMAVLGSLRLQRVL
jgi:hypothetical protein